MTLVASLSHEHMAQTETMLMEPLRLQLPRLPSFNAEGHRRARSATDDSIYDPPTPKPLLKRKRSWERNRAAAPRNRKRIFSYETEADMETYKGHVRTPADAIILFEACRLGLLPRVQRRLSEKERQSIKSGSVFVWDEREAGMRRWTDGKSWSASRVSGSFLTYREMEGKRGGGESRVFPPPPVTARSSGGRTPESGGGNNSDLELQQDEGPDGYRYKPDGLMKQSFSITTSSGNHLHLISYYSRSNPSGQQLPNPSNDATLRHIRPAKGMYPESTVHEHQNIPAVTRSPMAGGAPYSTVPQMAGYARQGPPQWSPQPNGHGWQQSPVHPQYPQQGYGYQYPPQNGGYYQSGPPPPANGQSPVQYSQPPPHLPQQSTGPPTPYDDRRPPHPVQSSYEDRRLPPSSQPIDPNLTAQDSRRPPLTPEDRQAPPPLQHPQEHVYGYGPREGSSAPQYDSRRYPPQPTAPQDRRPHSSHHSHPSNPSPNQSSYPPQHQQQYYNYPPQGPPPPQYGQQPPLHYAPHPQHPQHPQYPPPPQYQQPPPQQHYQQPPPPPQSSYPGPTSSNLQIDPALTAQSSPHTQQQSYSNAHSRTSTPSAQKPDSAGSAVQLDTRGTPQANTIPSIGALMNGSAADQSGNSPSSHSNGLSNGNGNTNGSSTPVPAGGESGGRSPSGGKKDGPQDIATDKVGFSEDLRALKVLDKGFR